MRTGPATTILSGLSVGMESSVWALVVICVSFIGALILYGGQAPIYVLYAVAMIGIGMLSHTGNNVAMDSYGPISDNANGIGEMAWHDRVMLKRKSLAKLWLLDAVEIQTRRLLKDCDRFSCNCGRVLISRRSSQMWEGAVAINHCCPCVHSRSDTKCLRLSFGGATAMLFSSLSIRAVFALPARLVEVVRTQSVFQAL